MLSVAALTLGDLVGVMDRDVVLPTGVDIELLAQIPGAHRRALEVPAGESTAPGRIPFLLSLHTGLGKFPDREIGRVALTGDLGDAPAAFLTSQVESRELRIAVEFRGVEVDSVRQGVGVPRPLEPLAEIDLLGDVLGGPAQHVGCQTAQPRDIVYPFLRIACGNLSSALTRLARGDLHLVLTGVGVIGQVAHIGDVDDVSHCVAERAQRALQQIRKHVGTHVADVLGGVDRGATAVHTNDTGLDRFEGLLGTCRSVVDDEPSHEGSSPCRATSSTTACAPMPSSRPIAPRPSVLVTLRFTAAWSAPTISASRLRIAS